MTARREARPPGEARPTGEQVAAAVGRRVPDVAQESLRVLFIGINPGLYSAAVGHHFARPGNRFWNALYLGGMTPTVLQPEEERDLLSLGIGVTNMVPRATAAAAELSENELRTGAQALERKLRSLRPTFAAFLGLGAFRTAFARPDAVTGEQPRRIGETRVWLLPNPSGLNAGHQLPDLARDFAELAKAAGFRAPRRPRVVG
jgi:TDG/mug DNA glycosylase family protein